MERKRREGVEFDRPIIILSAPRSGSTLLFETLSRAPGVYTIGNESHRIIEGWAGFHPQRRDYASNRLDASEATDAVAADIRAYFAAGLRDRAGNPLPEGVSPRFLEKTPKNILRVPFLRKVFPDSRLVVLVRDPRAVLSSMMEAWRSRLFVTYPDLPGWSGPPWSLLLVEGWRSVDGRPLEEIVAHQWASGMSGLLDVLEALPREAWVPLRYEALLDAPQATMQAICRELDLAWDLELQGLPLSRVTVTPPSREKWRRDEPAIRRVMPRIEPVVARMERVLARHAG